MVTEYFQPSMRRLGRAVGLGGSGAGRAGRAGRAVHTPHRCHRTGLGVERGQPGGAAAEPVSVEWHGVIWGVTVGWA